MAYVIPRNSLLFSHLRRDCLCMKADRKQTDAPTALPATPGCGLAPELRRRAVERVVTPPPPPNGPSAALLSTHICASARLLATSWARTRNSTKSHLEADSIPKFMASSLYAVSNKDLPMLTTCARSPP